LKNDGGQGEGPRTFTQDDRGEEEPSLQLHGDFNFPERKFSLGERRRSIIMRLSGKDVRDSGRNREEEDFFTQGDRIER